MPALSEGGDVYRVVLSEKKRALSQLIFISLNDKSVSYLLQWGTMADFSRLLRKYLRWSDKPPLRRTCPACVPSPHLLVYSSSWYWFIQVVLCLLFLFSSVKTGSQVFEREDGWCQCPPRNWRIKDNLRVKRCFQIPGVHSGHTKVPGFGRAWAIEAPE